MNQCGTCETCQFWTAHNNLGDCSQKMMARSGALFEVVTYRDYGCILHKKDNKKDELRVWKDETGKIHHSGITSDEYINEIVEYLSELKLRN